MSINATLNLAGSAMALSQAMLQTTGNNIANAGNADYTREVASATPNASQQLTPGIFVGTGANLTGIQRQIDDALESRLRGSISDTQAATTTQQWLGQIQTAFNALGTSNLSTQESTFFNSWSSLANTPQDAGLRQVVLQNGDNLAQSLQQLRGQLTSIQSTAGSTVQSLVGQANNLAQQIADLNGQIVTAGGGSGGDNGLLDQRDAAIKQLSQLMNVQTVDQSGGAVNVYVGSEPLVINADNLGISVTQSVSKGATTQGLVTYTPVFKNNGGTINITSGQLGALAGVQQQINGQLDSLDTHAHALIFELNKLHSSGQGLAGFSTVTAANAATNSAVALNDPRSGLKFTPKTAVLWCM